MSDRHACEALVPGYSHGRSYKCGKTAKMQHNGKWYCGIHDPVRRKEKRDAKTAEHDRMWEALERVAQRNAAIREARNAVIEAAKRAHVVHHSPARTRDACAASEELYAAVTRLNNLEAQS